MVYTRTNRMTNKQWHGGKGSAPRKGANNKQYEDNWEKIFGKKKTKPLTKPSQSDDPEIDKS